MQKQEMQELAELVSEAILNALESRGLFNKCGNAATNNVGKGDKSAPKSAYQKSEQLLYNYRGFQRIVNERMQEIEDIRKYGVPKRGGAVVEYGGNTGGTVQGIVLEEETVESAIRNVQRSVEGTVQALSMIDKCLAALKRDPYYAILEMRYFDGRTQEDIALELNCAQSTVSQHRSRLVKEFSMRMFPDQVVNEYLG